jgi:hypothetical protein
VEEREWEVAARERKHERERVGARMGGGAPGARLGQARSGWAMPRARPTTHCTRSLTSNRI